MKVPTLESLLVDQLKDLHSAESQLIKALPRMAKAVNAPELQEAIQNHLDETKQQLERLNEIGQELETKLTGKKCKAMEGLLEEGKEVFDMDAPPEIIDVAIIASAQRIEHYEISGYGTARALAEHLGHQEVVSLLTETLEEEAAADEKLTAICIENVLGAIEEVESDEEEEEMSINRRRMPAKR
jgi:ferritin-like metal-binding protein YciE